MREDIDRWDRKYAAADAHSAPEPDPWLAALAPRLAALGGPGGPGGPGALTLDVACGAGGNAVLLAGLDLDVIGLDGSLAGLRLARAASRRAGVRLRLAALDLERWRPPEARFALVTVFRFLHRDLYRALARSLAPGGVLAVRTFNAGRLRAVPGFNRDYLLAPGELTELFDGLEFLEIHDGEGDEDTSRALVRSPA